MSDAAASLQGRWWTLTQSVTARWLATHANVYIYMRAV